MNRTPGPLHGEATRLVAGFVAGFLLLALVPSVVWPWCRDLFDVAAAAPAQQFERKVEASALAALCGCVAVVLTNVRFRPALPMRPLALRSTLRAIVVWLPAWALLLGGYLWLMQVCGAPVPAQEYLRYFATASPSLPEFWLVVVAAAIGAPLAEELLFRGWLQPWLQAGLGRRTGLVVTALAFGLLHGLVYAVPITVLGLFLGMLAQRHASLLPAVLAHVANNALTVAAVGIWPPLFDWMYPR